MGINIGFGLDSSSTKGSETQQASQTTTTGKVLSQSAVDKLIYDVLSSDTGLASLATGENLSGGYAASTKALLAQDFVTKLVGELANVTAQTVSTEVGSASKTSKSSTTKASGGLKTVICTELNRQGLLSDDLYNHPKATAHFNSLRPETVRGYHFWAVPVVRKMQKSVPLSMALFPIAHGRYVQITTGKRTIGGMLTIWVGQPLCYVIGTLLSITDLFHGKQKGQEHAVN